MKVLHLADTHFDPFYKPGSNAECGEKYFCCREESGVVETPEAAAGYWGDYRNCDAPRWLLEAIFSHINETHQDLDLILWTGDLIPHNVWNTTREGNLDIIRQTVQMVKQYFPDTPVFPAIGNHESHPVNATSPSYPDRYYDAVFLRGTRNAQEHAGGLNWLIDSAAFLFESFRYQSQVCVTLEFNSHSRNAVC
ncbi:Sphingomyelin phosphodiesterase B [Penaeus vannamei]|uniref:Sphingomyelin phosphodiesterase B n=1 Tax=Penaeus vannamei TaxID=6689 RepID=A0A3R7QMX9_PENVA|nr:Sphingomyelin phosphodiesterase B [Penaeus vannamei]